MATSDSSSSSEIPHSTTQPYEKKKACAGCSTSSSSSSLTSSSSSPSLSAPGWPGNEMLRCAPGAVEADGTATSPRGIRSPVGHLRLGENVVGFGADLHSSSAAPGVISQCSTALSPSLYQLPCCASVCSQRSTPTNSSVWAQQYDVQRDASGSSAMLARCGQAAALCRGEPVAPLPLCRLCCLLKCCRAFRVSSCAALGRLAVPKSSVGLAARGGSRDMLPEHDLEAFGGR
jgi:hypothetical protein